MYAAESSRPDFEGSMSSRDACFCRGRHPCQEAIRVASLIFLRLRMTTVQDDFVLITVIYCP
jgi:hypothetical protein